MDASEKASCSEDVSCSRDQEGMGEASSLGAVPEQDQVPQEIVHDVDPPAVIHNDEAHRIANELWASAVARLANNQSSTGCIETSSKGLYLLTFARHPDKLDSVILESELVQSLRAAGINIRPPWANGAKVLTGFLTAGDLDIELCPRHVVVHAEDVQKILDSLRCIAYNQRPRLKPGLGQTAIPLEDSDTLIHTSSFAYSDVCHWCSEMCSSEHLTTVGEAQNSLVIVHSFPTKNTFIHFEARASARPRAESWP